MRLRIVVLAVVAMACGGGGGNGYPTDQGGNGSGAGSGSGSGSGGATANASVAMRSSDDGYGSATFSFAPTAVTITRGGTVTWNNEGGTVAHNVTFAPTTGAPSNIGNFTSGSTSRTFNTAGSYTFQCTNHSGMTGTVTVQ